MEDNSAQRVQLDIPCDVQQRDESGYPWAYLDEARAPEQIVPGAIVVSGDPDEPVVARVVEITKLGSGMCVRLQILPGEPAEYAEALARAHLLSA